MAPLSERQQKAQDLCDALREKGVPVVNSMPLADGCPLRFRVVAGRAEAIVKELKDKGWRANFVNSVPQFNLDGTTPMADIYEIDIPTPRTPVWGDRIPDAELALPSSAKKISRELEGFRKYWGLK
jgi:hypothetical protein